MRLFLFFVTGFLWFGNAYAEYTHTSTAVPTTPPQASQVEKNGLPSFILGCTDAKHTLELFFSPTCTHCVPFIKEQFYPPLKGDNMQSILLAPCKLKVNLRLLPNNDVDIFIGMLAWSRGAVRFLETAMIFLKNQDFWLPVVASQDLVQRKEMIEQWLQKLPQGVTREAVVQTFEMKLDAPENLDFMRILALQSGFSLQEIVMAEQADHIRNSIMLTIDEYRYREGDQIPADYKVGDTIPVIPSGRLDGKLINFQEFESPQAAFKFFKKALLKKPSTTPTNLKKQTRLKNPPSGHTKSEKKVAQKDD